MWGRTAAIVVVCFAVGVLATLTMPKLRPLLQGLMHAQTELFVTADPTLTPLLNSTATVIGWQDLMPHAQREVLSRYTAAPNEVFSDQVMRSIQASNDEEYKAALQSRAVAQDLLGKVVSIAGFIVPLEANEERAVTRFFVVPYFGACVHFPPPPPNQLIYVALSEGFAELDFAEAFTLTGRLTQALFEDPLGTSAYQLEVIRIQPFYGQPDDARIHNN